MPALSTDKIIGETSHIVNSADDTSTPWGDVGELLHSSERDYDPFTISKSKHEKEIRTST